jgi:hypothetical protein
MHIRCPHCHNPVEVVGDDLSDFTCPSCGSNFSLISADTTATHREAGNRTIGHFELVQQVGVGAFGSVWKARDTELDRIVAIKLPRQGQLDGPGAEAFFREARAAAQLRHPQIVGVHEIGREDDTIYIVSDFVEGANLKEWLSSQRFSAREAAELVARIAEALHHAHEAGVVHRDLKPSNIMLDANGQPHITDFGLAKRDQGEMTITVEGRVLGTPVYMPPEQAKGEGHHADQRSDVYSLGVMLFELLTGEVPFRGDAQMVVLQIQKDEPPRLRRLNARIPRDLETITLKCLEKDPAKRYQTAAALADDLGRWLGGKPILARPLGGLARSWRWAKRNPTVTALSVAIGALLTGATIGVGIVASIMFERAATEAVLRTEAEKQTAAAVASAEHAKSAQELAERRTKELEAAQRARLLAEMGQEHERRQRAMAEQAEEHTRNLEGQRLMLDRPANAAALQRRWFDAIKYYQAAIEGTVEQRVVISLAIASLAAGDDAGYRRACERLWARNGEKLMGDSFPELATVCTAGPDALPDMEPLLKLVETWRRGRVDYHLVVTDLAIHYRAGQYAQVIKLQQTAEMGYFVVARTPSYANVGWLRVPQTLFTAMAYQHLGKPDDAKKYLTIARLAHDTIVERQNNSVDTESSLGVLHPAAWQSRVMLELLRREAETLIGKSD